MQLAPSGRSVLLGIGIACAAAAAYTVALETSLFAVQHIRVVGGGGRAQAEVERALAPELGRSLMRVHAGSVAAMAERSPDVVSVTVDRDFPHTLVVHISPERADLILHQGASAWLVSTRARVLRRVWKPGQSSLPRTWVPASTPVAAGQTLAAADGGLAAASVAPLVGDQLPVPVRVVRASGTELTLVTPQHFEIRLGSIGDLRLKLAVARSILRLVGADVGPSGYLDVSVPQRPVYHAAYPQVST
ncbi:MAG TPA: FtsQ-type POTRA domain-containing protein [Solirubrobacteraceae bacterium]|nr:FtsQ-type POTRA domain-containing protein [Solirubrobacteraceae bacterium]